tara:strand:+ start:244 stop:444 length:201 start_codon:yes stop_codon:yes gene_type:complete
MDNKWISIRMRVKEIEEIDSFRGTLTEALGISVSRNAFLRHIIFNNLNYQLDKVRTTKGIEPVFAD